MAVLHIIDEIYDKILYMRIAAFKLEEWMNKYEVIAEVDLTTTCIQPLSLQELLHLSGTNLSSISTKPLGYGDITGSERLKTAIKGLYNNQGLKNITVTHGAIGANQLVFLSLLEKGDEVVSIVPTYQQHYSIPEALNCNVKLFWLKEENQWLPDLNELNKIISPKTKLLCLNTPNNPTGAVIPDWQIQEIVQIAKKNNVWILADEAYRGLNLTDNPYSQSFADIYDKGISVGTMSKTYSLPGLRVGWIIGREDLINEINHQRQYNTISVSILDDYFAAIALENKNCIQTRNFNLMHKGLGTLQAWLDLNPHVQCVLPTGGTTTLLKYNLNLPSEQFCQQFQHQTKVALLPGSVFDMEGYVRICFCADRLKDGLQALTKFRDNYINK